MNEDATKVPRTYTVTQLAEVLQLKPATIRAKARDGSWPCLQFGPRTIRFTEAHLATILKACESAPSPPPLTRLHRRRGEPPRYAPTAP